MAVRHRLVSSVIQTITRHWSRQHKLVYPGRHIMARYNIESTVVDTKNATASYDEDTFFDGHNHISRATGSQWNHQTLYRSAKGRYYIVCTSQWQGSHTHAEWLSPEAAVRWLLTNCHEVPEELGKYVASVTE